MQRVLNLVVVAGLGLPALALPDTVRLLIRQALAGRRGIAPTVLGLAVGAAVYALLAARSFRFWRVLHHELAHAFVALILLARPSALVVAGGGGHIKYEMSGPLPGVRRFLIGIAPYCLSPVALAAGALLSLASNRDPRLIAICAVAIGFGLTATLMEISPRQTDLRQRGFVFATVCALWIWGAVAVVLIFCLTSTAPFTTVADTYQRAGTAVVERIGLGSEESRLADHLLTFATILRGLVGNHSDQVPRNLSR